MSLSVFFAYALILTDPMLPELLLTCYGFHSPIEIFISFTDFCFSITNLRYNMQITFSKFYGFCFALVRHKVLHIFEILLR